MAQSLPSALSKQSVQTGKTSTRQDINVGYFVLPGYAQDTADDVIYLTLCIDSALRNEDRFAEDDFGSSERRYRTIWCTCTRRIGCISHDNFPIEKMTSAIACCYYLAIPESIFKLSFEEAQSVIYIGAP